MLSSSWARIRFAKQMSCFIHKGSLMSIVFNVGIRDTSVPIAFDKASAGKIHSFVPLRCSTSKSNCCINSNHLLHFQSDVPFLFLFLKLLERRKLNA